ncbi:nucleotidyl transferase AbiEii/AbiGii toxin family protein [Yinghuangia soli]|uniref:Nucleotidyl transferase AbiEii/AbiGii toxin family protein n=1 Tax=Yinghuangia soli TaxID=2908204 RepID=A0AA41PZ64_9ACTN|nr:nucleotidyl transferase AbiEii/AbiGii toxin family protein [Yinghuangia soli]MCF2527826.1 nucleotidyl transferase AbiEii/AbiGii toxin family protein [Yinghuangia soli]
MTDPSTPPVPPAGVPAVPASPSEILGTPPDPRDEGPRHPETLMRIPDSRVAQELVFDPAHAWYGQSYRASEPSFGDPVLAAAWHAARRCAMDTVLTALAGSPWADKLVLRGSVMLRAWLGEAAREPGDLDFVAVPRTWKVGDPATQVMLTSIPRLVAEESDRRNRGGVVFAAQWARSDEIWTYDRAPGRRLVLPWSAPGIPGGLVQLDFVFEETLHVEPEPSAIPLAGGGTAVLLAATPELSLGWKIIWLLTDLFPEGKDLYDAVLLAEWMPLPLPRDLMGLLIADLEDAQYYADVDLDEIRRACDDVDWRGFAADYPGLAVDQEDLVRRLLAALAPTFGAEQPG